MFSSNPICPHRVSSSDVNVILVTATWTERSRDLPPGIDPLQLATYDEAEAQDHGGIFGRFESER